MCGIAGILTLANIRDHSTGGKTSVNECLSRMVRRISHRGPDDQGMEVIHDGTAQLGLGNTRLAILDLSPAGHQPMKHPATENWITYNGEIYNYLQLRDQLGGKSKEQGQPKADQPMAEAKSRERSAVVGLPSSVDIAWQSTTDTEVILRAYARWGRECVQHLRGMFAFAIYDRGPWTGDRGPKNRDGGPRTGDGHLSSVAGHLFLARDPFGIKPLYYYQTEDSFLFASEIRALLASGLVPRRLSLEGLSSYLHYGSVQEPSTIIEGVRSLLPGHYLVVNGGDTVQVTDVEYARKGIGEEPTPPMSNRREAVATLRYDLEESVRLHLVSDVPVGVFLSGGIDSSAVVALMSQVAGQKPKTFSVVFGEKEFSEASYASLIAKQFGTEHHEIPLAERDLLNMLPAALEAMDQPTMDGINTFVVSKAVKEAGITVALSGLGGDELFAGYPSFRRAVQLHRLATTPFAIRQFASAAGRAILNGSVRNRKFWDLLDSDCSPYAAYALSRQLFSPSEISALMGRGQRSGACPEQSRRVTGQRSSVSDQRDVINEVSRLELGGYMANTLLRDTDQMSMAHGLEVRVPFVDTVVVQSVLALPGEWKVDGTRPKPLLVDAMTGLLPQEIWRRPKMGFTLPFQRWLRAGLKSEIGQVLLDKNGIERMGLNGDEIRGIWEAFKNNPQQEPWSRPWALYVLKQWCERNGVTA